eukprot:1988906-Pleurochrysis_carterae.AAC.1
MPRSSARRPRPSRMSAGAVRLISHRPPTPTFNLARVRARARLFRIWRLATYQLGHQTQLQVRREHGLHQDIYLACHLRGHALLPDHLLH